MPPALRGTCRLSLPPGSWGSPLQPASSSKVASSAAALLRAGKPLSPPFPPSLAWAQQGVPAWDNVPCRGLGLPIWVRSGGTRPVPGASFGSLPGQSSLGTGSLWELWLSPAGFPLPSPGQGCGSGTDPTLFRVARAKAFPSRPWRRGSALALLGDQGCQAGSSSAPEQPAGHGELQQGRGGLHSFTVPASALPGVKRNYFSHLGHFRGEQIPPELHFSC